MPTESADPTTTGKGLELLCGQQETYHWQAAGNADSQRLLSWWADICPGARGSVRLAVLGRHTAISQLTGDNLQSAETTEAPSHHSQRCQHCQQCLSGSVSWAGFRSDWHLLHKVWQPWITWTLYHDVTNFTFPFTFTLWTCACAIWDGFCVLHWWISKFDTCSSFRLP
jgi:hypothetical protein